jgi:exodeoxyribonuclease-5
MSEIVLTDEQEEAVTKITAFLLPSDKSTAFRFGGYAGTGKTTVIRALLERLQEKYRIAVCAFTGKAVSVLQRKQIYIAQTMHSLLYDCEIQPNGTMEFHKKHKLDQDYNFIIVDEASMVSTELYMDLMSFGKKVLFVGDPAQLEPVGDNPNLMRLTDFVLTKIHRQAEESPIITLASKIRLGGTPVRGTEVPGLTVKNKDLNGQIMTAANQVIVARNTTRNNFNKRFRQYYKYEPQCIVEGEKLICLRNNAGFGVFNGMILFVTKIIEETKTCWMCDLKDEIGKELKRVPVWKDPFIVELEKESRIPREFVYCDYGYAITCHKSQGSEWDSVLVYDEPMPARVWSMPRWRYTAITRAAKQLTYCI